MILSIFPSLLFLQYYAPTILRIVLGIIFAEFGWSKLTSQKAEKITFFDSIGLKPGSTFVWIIGLLEIISGLSLVAGFMTQIGALIAIVILSKALYIKKRNPTSLKSSLGFLFLCLIIAVSLMLTGPGNLAFDLPL